MDTADNRDGDEDMARNGGGNYGIYQSGSGSIDNSGPLAVGEGASASSGPAPGQEPSAAEALAQLRRLLAAHGGELPDAARAQARGEVEEVADQLDSPARDRGRLAAALARLVSALASVTVLATAAEALKTAVEKLLG